MNALIVTGRLTADARAHITRGESWQLSLELSPPAGPKGKPRRYLAVKDYGTGVAAAFACKGQARYLSRGVLVRVHAAAEDEMRGRSVLSGVDRIEAPDIPPTYTEKVSP